MAGPIATILLANELTPHQGRAVGDLIDAISENVCDDDFSVITTRPIGGSADFPGRPFVSSTGKLGDPLTFGYSDSELDQIANLLRFNPTASLSFAAMCNDPLDHEILARICCCLGRELHGVVDFNGRIACDPATQTGLYEIEYTNYLYQPATRHVCSPVFLAKYLRHADFRMVK